MRRPGDAEVAGTSLNYRLGGNASRLAWTLVVAVIVSGKCLGVEDPQWLLPEGYRVQRVAGPPLVAHPMMAGFDDRGRLFVTESAGINLDREQLEAQLPNKVLMLEDLNSDGVFDRRTVFADRLTLPMGALWHDGALYVAAPPNVWRLRDADGDGVAERREALIGSFGYTGNAASVHGPFLAPTGRIYWCHGRHGHQLHSGGSMRRAAAAYVISARPDGSDVRVHCGGGMDNPVELDFTPEGEPLGTVNILYVRPREDCLVHWQYGGAYPHSQRVLGEFRRTGDLLGPIQRFGHVAVSGMVRYRSGSLSSEFRGDYFVAAFNTGRIMRCDVTRDGASFRANVSEFLASTNRNFHPTDIVEDADGSLLVVDTGGWFRNGCPTSQIARPDVKGAIYRVFRDAADTPDDPWGRLISVESATNPHLVEMLEDERFQVRQRVLAECARRGDPLVRLLSQLVQRHPDQRVRMRAIWALARLGSTRAEAAIHAAFSDPSWQVRLAACRAAAAWADPSWSDRLFNLITDKQAAVRREAAALVGRSGGPDAVPALLECLATERDSSEAHAFIFALIEIDCPAATAAGLESPAPNARRAALIALDQMASGSLAPQQVVPLLEDAHAPLRLAALDVTQRHSDWAATTRPLLAKWLHAAWEPSTAHIARGLITAFAADAETGDLVGKVLANTETDARWRVLLLEAIRDSGVGELHSSWIEPVAHWMEAEDRRTSSAAVAVARSLGSDPFSDILDRIAGDEQRPVMIRIAALQAASGARSRLGNAAFDLLIRVLEHQETVTESAEAARLLGESALNDSQQTAMLALMESAGPLELKQLIRPYASVKSANTAARFLEAVANASGFLSLTPGELSDTIKNYPPELLPRANTLLEKLKQHDRDKQQRLQEFQQLVSRANARRGRTLFQAEKSKCSTCHRVGSEGGRIGPDLTTIGRIRTDRDLLEAIVFPSASIARQFETYNILTDEGKVLTGLIVDETARAVTLQPQVGDPIVVPRESIDELSQGSLSLMPTGLEDTLTPAELADVVAYLMTLK